MVRFWKFKMIFFEVIYAALGNFVNKSIKSFKRFAKEFEITSPNSEFKYCVILSKLSLALGVKNTFVLIYNIITVYK